MRKQHSLRTRALQSRGAIELLSSKWRVTVLHLLTPGPLRASKLQRAILQVSPKVLTQTLRGLERDGLIQRKVHNTIPPHVEYELTHMGASVIPLLRNLSDWAKAHAKMRDDARYRFDLSRKILAGETYRRSPHAGRSSMRASPSTEPWNSAKLPQVRALPVSNAEM
jgi:DNA-binding HxlR family transcriptional regulator